MENSFGFFGNFSSWSEALSYCHSDPAGFLEKVKTAILKVKAGEAACERDSVLFDKVQYSYPVLAYLLRIATSRSNRLHLLDFGGSLGSSYFQCRDFLQHLKEVRWNIVEQEHYVACGREFVQDEVLKFYYSMDECLAETSPDAVLLSGVLQCLEDPYGLLEQIMNRNFEYIIIDRTPFIPAEDRLTVFVIPPELDDSVHPYWLFRLEHFLGVLQSKYELVDDYDSDEGEGHPIDDGLPITFKGFLFKRRRERAEGSAS